MAIDSSQPDLSAIDPDAPLWFTSEMHVKPESVARFRELIAANNELARAQPACRILHCQQDANDPTVFLMFESWDSLADFMEQEMAQPWMAEYLAAIEPLLTGERTVRLWSPVL